MGLSINNSVRGATLLLATLLLLPLAANAQVSVEDFEALFSPLVSGPDRDAACGSAGGTLELTWGQAQEISSLEFDGLLNSTQAGIQRRRLANNCAITLLNQLTCNLQQARAARNIDQVTCSAQEDSSATRNCTRALNNLLGQSRVTGSCRREIREQCNMIVEDRGEVAGIQIQPSCLDEFLR